MSWWTTASLADGLVYEVVAIVCFMAAFAALVVTGGLFIHVCTRPPWSGGPVWLNALWSACIVAIAVACSSAGQAAWPSGHPVGIAFVAVVVGVAAIPVAMACAAIVALCARWAVDDETAMHGTAADQLDAFIESVEERSRRERGVLQLRPAPDRADASADG